MIICPISNLYNKEELQKTDLYRFLNIMVIKPMMRCNFVVLKSGSTNFKITYSKFTLVQFIS